MPLRLRAGHEQVGAVAEADPGAPHFPELSAHGRRCPEHGDQFVGHHLADGVVVLHGKHARPGAHVHAVCQRRMHNQGLSGLGAAADRHLLHAGHAPCVHDPGKVRVHVPSVPSAGIRPIFYDEVPCRPDGQRDVRPPAKDVSFAGGETKQRHHSSPSDSTEGAFSGSSSP